MEVIIDACTIILLGKATVLEKFAETNEIYITKSEYNEVMKGKAMMFLDALILEKLCLAKKILIKDIDNKMTDKIMKDFNMGEGEASIIAYGITNIDFIVATDNRQGRKAAIINNLSLVGSVEIVVSLFKKGKIDKDKAIESIKTLNEFGWFNSYLIEKALEEIK